MHRGLSAEVVAGVDRAFRMTPVVVATGAEPRKAWGDKFEAHRGCKRWEEKVSRGACRPLCKGVPACHLQLLPATSA